MPVPERPTSEIPAPESQATAAARASALRFTAAAPRTAVIRVPAANLRKTSKLGLTNTIRTDMFPV